MRPPCQSEGRGAHGHHRFGGGLAQRNQDAPAAAEQLGKAGFGPRMLGPGDRLARGKVNPGAVK